MSTNNPQNPGPFPGQRLQQPAGSYAAGSPAQPGWPGGQVTRSNQGMGGPLPATPLGTTSLKPTVRWDALPALSKAFRVIAWLCLVGGALSFLIALISLVGALSANNPSSSSYNPYAGLQVAASGYGLVSALVIAVLGFVLNLTVSEMIGVFLAIEWNTRKD